MLIDVFMCPSLKETSLDRDQYLLRLAQTVRIDLASSLGIDIVEAGSLEIGLNKRRSQVGMYFLTMMRAVKRMNLVQPSLGKLQENR